MLHTRASVLHDAGRLQESEASVREAIAVRRGLGDVLPRDQVARLSDSLELLANVLTADRRLAEADALSAEVLTMRERVGWSERARGLLNRSATLLAAGREAEGLEVAMELVRGALDQPGESGVADLSFVNGLVNLGVLLRFNGHWEQALAVQQQAVTELRPLAATGDEDLRADLATALCNHSLMFTECGRPEDGVASGAEALAIREELAAGSPEIFGAVLTESLNNQAVVLYKLGRHEEAEELAARCVDLRRDLHAARPRAFGRKLANALTTHAEMLTHCGRAEVAVEVGREAVERMVALEAAEPGDHTLWLAAALDTWAAALAADGDEARAFDTSGEALARARVAYGNNPAGVGDVLAQTLMACAERHGAHRREAAVTWVDEALEVLRSLAVDQPAAHAVALARAEELWTGLSGTT